MSVKWMVFLIVVGFFCGSQAFIYEARVLRKWDPERNRYHYFIGCGDFHDNHNAAISGQMKKLHEMFQRSKQKNAKFIVEDLSSRNIGGCQACGNYRLGEKGGILSGLATHCRTLGLEVDNVEYRFCRVIALGPVMDCLRQGKPIEPYSIARTKEIGMRQLRHEVDTVLKEVQAYDDGPILNGFYKGQFGSINNCFLKHFDRHAGMNVACYLDNHCRNNWQASLSHILTFDSNLIDMRMLHIIANAADKEYIVAIAGNTHIGVTADMLEKLGYEKVHEVKPRYVREGHRHRCVGNGPSKGHSCVRPEPIELGFLERYM